MLTVTLPPVPLLALTPLPAFWIIELFDILVSMLPPEVPSDRTPPPLLLSICVRLIDTLVVAPLAGAIITPTLLFRTVEFFEPHINAAGSRRNVDAGNSGETLDHAVSDVHTSCCGDQHTIIARAPPVEVLGLAD